jgi:hypothetical protein
MFSLTVARQRGNCTRFPAFAERQRRANRRTSISKIEYLWKGIYRERGVEVNWLKEKVPVQFGIRAKFLRHRHPARPASSPAGEEPALSK